MDIIKKLIRIETWPANSFELPKLQAHRGFWKNGARENTLEAFIEAKKQGAEIFECDVRLTKDKIPIIFHDDDCLRIAGENKKVDDLTAEEMFKITRAPRLESVLTSPDITPYINIELKTKKTLNESLERRVRDVVVQTKSQNRILFSSFNPVSLWKISQYLPEVPRALLVSHEKTPENKFYLRQMLFAPLLKLHMLNLDSYMVNHETMKTWNERQIPISVWTVNDVEQIKHMEELGVASVITDNFDLK